MHRRGSPQIVVDDQSVLAIVPEPFALIIDIVLVV